jgi:HlyD family secretion protein
MIKNALLTVFAVAGACARDEVPPGYQGVVELDERTLAFEVPGRVATISAKRGDSIDPSKILATLDDSEAKTAVAIREAEARAVEERAKLVARSGRPEDIQAVQAQIRAASSSEAFAKKRLEDDMKLVNKGAIASSVIDEDQNRFEAATAQRQALEQQLRELRTGARTEEVTGAQANAAAAAGNVDLERERESRHTLHATEAGEILDVHVDPGEVVAAGTPVFTVGDPAHPYIDVFVPQQDIAGIHIGTAANVRVDSLKQLLPGNVEWISRRTEFTPRFVFNEERANLVIRTRVRVTDPQRQLHAGTPAFVVFTP